MSILPMVTPVMVGDILYGALSWLLLSWLSVLLFLLIGYYTNIDWNRGFPRKWKAICIVISPIGIVFTMGVFLFLGIRWLYRELTGYGEQ